MEKEEIPYGEKMISFKIRFWTNKLPNKKMAWDSGAITLSTNRSRGLRNIPGNHEFFNSFEEIEKAIKKMLKRNDIVIVKKDKSKNLIVVNLDE